MLRSWCSPTRSRTLQLYVGTSGFSYREWKGHFYPEKLPAKDMLSYYATRLPAVEINNTFYRMPRTDVLEAWAAQVPDRFRFVLKASQRITHRKRLKEVDEEVGYLYGTISVLGPRLGAVLFQMPPFLRKDIPLLEAFAKTLPPGARAALEFRHGSWFEDDVYDRLRSAGLALCMADTEDEETPRLVGTADFGYLRLRRPDYTDADLERWAAGVLDQKWSAAFVFFKHEDAATGPRLAARFLEIARSGIREDPDR